MCLKASGFKPWRFFLAPDFPFQQMKGFIIGLKADYDTDNQYNLQAGLFFEAQTASLLFP
jgi:hypothetical protein